MQLYQIHSLRSRYVRKTMVYDNVGKLARRLVELGRPFDQSFEILFFDLTLNQRVMDAKRKFFNALAEYLSYNPIFKLKKEAMQEVENWSITRLGFTLLNLPNSVRTELIGDINAIYRPFYELIVSEYDGYDKESLDLIVHMKISQPVNLS